MPSGHLALAQAWRTPLFVPRGQYTHLLSFLINSIPVSHDHRVQSNPPPQPPPDTGYEPPDRDTHTASQAGSLHLIDRSCQESQGTSRSRERTSIYPTRAYDRLSPIAVKLRLRTSATRQIASLHSRNPAITTVKTSLAPLAVVWISLHSHRR